MPWQLHTPETEILSPKTWLRKQQEGGEKPEQLRSINPAADLFTIEKQECFHITTNITAHHQG